MQVDICNFDKNEYFSRLQNGGCNNKVNAFFPILFLALTFLSAYSCKGKKQQNFLQDENTSIYAYIDTLNAISYNFRDTNLDSMKFYAERAIEESEKAHYILGLGDGYTRLGIYEKKNDNYQAALEYYRKSLDYRSQLDSPILLAKVYSNIGIIYKENHIYDSSIYYHNKSIVIADSLNNLVEKSNYLSNIGVTYDNFQDFKKALYYYLQAYEIRKHIKSDKIYESCNNIGSAYFNMENYDSSLYYLRQVLQNTSSIEVKLQDIAIACNNAGLNFQELKLPDSAKYYFQESIKNYTASKSISGLSKALSNMGILCMEQKQYDECVQYLLQSTEIAEKLGNQALLEENYAYLGDYYLLNNQPKVAATYYAKAIQCDTALQEETDRQIKGYAEIQTQFIEEQAQKEQQRQQAEAQKREFVLKAIIGSVAACMIILWLLFSRRGLKKKIEYQNKLAQDRTRISSDLHDDIGAALSSISMYSDVVKMQVEKKQFDDANHLLTEIATTSRELMDNMSDLVWAINPKNDSFGKIVQRTKAFAHRILQVKNINLQFTGGDNMENINMPMEVRHNLYMIYKEAINNAAKYSCATDVNITVQKQGDSILSRIADNGKGFILNGDNEGNGLKNMKRRAEEIGASIKLISNLGAGTSIEVQYTIP
jgi:signal transduction histidine kinase